MPISPSCILKKENLVCWPHLRGIDIPAVGNREVLLLIALKEKPSLSFRWSLRQAESTNQ